MRTVMVSYRVKSDRVQENEELVRAVYAQLHATDPTGLSYGTFKCEDGAKFVHIAEMQTARTHWRCSCLQGLPVRDR